MIKKIIKTTKKNKGIYRLLREVYVYYAYLKNKHILAEIEELKNKYKGERCFVIGNGSSINQQDLKKLKDEYTFVCNHFYFHKEINIIKPTFYKMTAPIILDDFFREKTFPETIKKINLYAHLNPEAIFFFNIQYKKYIEDNKLFLKNKVYYSLASSFFISDKMSLDMAKPHPFGMGSVFFLPAMAAYLGFNPIYMLGFDHDYILQRDEKHFYQSDENLSQMKKSSTELAEIFYRNQEWLKILNKHFQKEGIQIFNAGVGGMIDTFPRVDYKNLFCL